MEINQDRERLINNGNTATNNDTATNNPSSFSNLSLLDRIKAAQQQLNTKPEVAAMNSRSSSGVGYKAPAGPSTEIKKVPVPKEEDPMHVATTPPMVDEEQQIEDELNIEEDVAFIHEPNTNQYIEPSTPIPTNYPKENLQFSSFHIEPMLSSMYEGIQKRVDGFLRPSHDNDTDEPLLMNSQNRQESNYSMKVYCITMFNDIYDFTIGRLPVKYRKVASATVVIFISLLLFHVLDII